MYYRPIPSHSNRVQYVCRILTLVLFHFIEQKYIMLLVMYLMCINFVPTVFYDTVNRYGRWLPRGIVPESSWSVNCALWTHYSLHSESGSIDFGLAVLFPTSCISERCSAELLFCSGQNVSLISERSFCLVQTNGLCWSCRPSLSFNDVAGGSEYYLGGQGDCKISIPQYRVIILGRLGVDT